MHSLTTAANDIDAATETALNAPDERSTSYRSECPSHAARMERTGTVPVCHKSIQSARQPARVGASQTEPGRLFVWLARGEKVQKIRKLKKNVNDTFVFFNFFLIYVLKTIKKVF